MPLLKTEATAAGEIASRLISQVQITANGIKQLFANGAKENKQLNNPAVSAQAIKEALGPDAVACLESIVKSVS